MATDGASEQRTFTQEEVGCSDVERFVLELEFIQCLANPWYLNHLAQNKYFEDPAFLNYLKYLEYWRQPQYVQYIKHPHCLAMLNLLQNENFRKALALPQNAEEIHKQQFFHWAHHLANRAKEVAGEAAAGGAEADRGLGCTATNMAIESALAAEGNGVRPAAAVPGSLEAPAAAGGGGDGTADAAGTAVGGEQGE